MSVCRDVWVHGNFLGWGDTREGEQIHWGPSDLGVKVALPTSTGPVCSSGNLFKEISKLNEHHEKVFQSRYSFLTIHRDLTLLTEIK